MEIKIKAYNLRKQGLSYGAIAKQLGISKTGAFEYVKEGKYISLIKNQNPIQTSTVLVKNESSEPKKTIAPNIPNPNNQIVNQIKVETQLPVKLQKPLKEFTGDELIQKKFESLNFEGKFLELIGRPSKVFAAIIWGLPKGGKSNFALRFADYLQEYFGSVLYIAAEEGESVTLQEKFKEIGGSKMKILECKNKDEIKSYLINKDYNFVFIDSINNAGIDNDFLESLKADNPKKSFIAIVQATKGGNFKGDQGLTHNCDFIIKVEQGIAHHTGRFGVASSISIFESPLYEKKRVEEPLAWQPKKMMNPIKMVSKQPKSVAISQPTTTATNYHNPSKINWGGVALFAGALALLNYLGSDEEDER